MAGPGRREIILCCGIFRCCQLFIITHSIERKYLVESKLEIKRGKSREIKNPPPLGLKVGQKHLKGAKPCHGTPHLPHVKFNCPSDQTPVLPNGFDPVPCDLLWTCCHPQATPSPPPEGNGLLLRGTISDPSWGRLSAKALFSPLPHCPGGPPQGCQSLSDPEPSQPPAPRMALRAKEGPPSHTHTHDVTSAEEVRTFFLS